MRVRKRNLNHVFIIRSTLCYNPKSKFGFKLKERKIYLASPKLLPLFALDNNHFLEFNSREHNLIKIAILSPFNFSKL